MTPAMQLEGTGQSAANHRNEVWLVGRLAAPAVERTLPSGDILATWRLVIDRDDRRAQQSRPRAPRVDTFDCVVFTGGLRRRVTRWVVDDLIEVRGVLRRRFWRGGGGPVSRCEVEVRAARRVGRGP